MFDSRDSNIFQSITAFDQESLANIREAERALPTPAAAREFISYIEDLKAGELTQGKMIDAYSELVRVVKAIAPSDTVGYLQGHPIEEIIAGFKSASVAPTPQEVCAQLLVKTAQIAEVNHNNFQVKVSNEYGTAIGQRVGNILFQSELASQAQPDSLNVKAKTANQLASY